MISASDDLVMDMSLRMLKEYIRGIANNPPHEAVIELTRVAEHIEGALILAMNNINVVTRSLPSTLLQHDLLEWAKDRFDDLRFNPNVLDSVLKRTELIIRSSSLASTHTAAISMSSTHGGIRLEWFIPERYMTWIVRPCFFAWPGIHVEVLIPDSANRFKSIRVHDMDNLELLTQGVIAGTV